MNLIILTQADRIGEGHYRLADKRAKHVRSVLHCEIGDTIEVGLLNGPQGTALIEKVNDDEVMLKSMTLKQKPTVQPIVDIICALPRPQTLKKVLMISATMSVRRLHLIRANRVEKSYFHSPLLKKENYMPFLLDGLSQGKHTRIPDVHIHDRFKPFFLDTLPDLNRKESVSSCRLLPDMEDTTANLNDVYDSAVDRILIAIGPEGGWVPFEIELMESQRFRRFSLGRWVLRVETAVAGVLSQIELIRTMKN
ncbi:MAG: RsmE family RNA methyltransferase [candidate division Zixibacteria bacterium]|nr:RsmE family RNA methyltransferase [candidate division Zixibacteria bacterium]